MGRFFRRELCLAWRGGGGAAVPLAWFLAFMAWMPFALGSLPEALPRAAAGLSFSAALLAALISAESWFQEDLEDGTLETLVLEEGSLWAIIVVKAMARWAGSLMPLVFLAPLTALALGTPLKSSFILALALCGGGPALVYITSLAAALTAGIRRSGLLIALIALPLQTPLLIFGVSACEKAFQVKESPLSSLLFLFAFSLISFALCPPAAAVVLKAQLEE